MVQPNENYLQQVREFLSRAASASVLAQGEALTASSAVSECYKDGAKILGHIKDQQGESLSSCLYVIAPNEIEPSCSCPVGRSAADNRQWCEHAVALLLTAAELGIFESLGGFDAPESLLRPHISSPREIALTLNDIASADKTGGHQVERKLDLLISIKNGGLGIRPIINGELFVPNLFEPSKINFERKLDQILLDIISRDGIWDDEGEVWNINGSQGIDTVLGLLKEYDSISWINNSDRPNKNARALQGVNFSTEIAKADIELDWGDEEIEIKMNWEIPSGKSTKKTKTDSQDLEIMGSGPHWLRCSHSIFKISADASRILSLFPHDQPITINKRSAGPLVEFINANKNLPASIKILNKHRMPKASVVAPTPKLDLRLQTNRVPGANIELIALLEFEYPEAKSNKEVYLPDRSKEGEAFAFLEQAGFTFDPSIRRYKIINDRALDLIDAGQKIFPSHWSVIGFKEIKKGLKFADLSLNISVNSPSDKDWNGEDWFDCHVALTQNGAAVPLSTIFKNENPNSDRWVQLDSGAYARVPGESLTQLRAALGAINSSFWMSNNIKNKLSSAQTVGLASLDKRMRINLDAAGEAKKLLKKIENFKEIESISVPKKFKGKLRPYQKQGLDWLNFLSDFGFGGILADEMGLGKTVQTLSFLQHLKDNGNKKPTLIVVPTSIITNWFYEAQRFTPDLKVLILHGPGRKNLFSKIREHDVIITSYALLRLDYRDLERHSYSHFILDEAQNIKNDQAATTKAAKSIKAERRLALSGTPTENRPMELWSIMDFLMPGYLGTAEFFKKYFEKPILEVGTKHPAAEHLRAKVKPFLLKRKKVDVEKDLPPKVESVVHVEMTAAQQAIYVEMLSDIRPRIMGEIADKGVSGASISILAALLRLRQVCNHPQSIDAFSDFKELTSGKFNALQELVEEALDSNRKILLYSQFVAMLGLMKGWLDQKGIPYLYLDGRTKNRQDLVDKFNSDDSTRLFLISLKAGGVGLNLTGADTVIIYDPWWNPAVEDQAADRAHRIGQKKAVAVYRLVTENSIEQRIMDLKAKKAELVDALLNDRGLSTLKLTKADIESLFTAPPPIK
jgi:superfamily II DNA or RNA helicase